MKLLETKLSCYQLKMYCFVYGLSYVRLMITIMQKPRVHAQKGEKKKHGIPLWKINHLQSRLKEKEKKRWKYRTTRKQ